MRRFLAFVPTVLLATPVATAAQGAPWPGAAWPTASSRAQNLDPGALEALDAGIRAGRFGNVDRMVVIRNGYLVFDGHYDRDYREISRGRRGPIGCGTDACADGAPADPYNYFDPATHPWWRGRDVHTLQSVTKSVTSALIGVAIERGEVPGVSAPLLSFFGGYDLTGVDPRLRDATLEDLLEMRTGIEWHEADRPLDETNTTLQLERSDDWVRFTLAQPMDASPGEKWAYNSGGSHLMSAVLRSATGRTADEYAREHLFGPIGIRDFHWKRTPEGLPDSEGGLYLEALDLARIGYLYLRGGVWNGRRILPEGWVEASTARRVDRVNAAGFGYGYQWWRIENGAAPVWAGLGFGGQFLVVLPEQDIVGVINSWNVFGGRVENVLGAFVEVLLQAEG